MVSVVLAILLSLFALPAGATTRYVDPTAGPCTGNYSIASRNCTGTDGDSFSTFALALSPTVAGDTIYWRSGTYTTRIALGSKTGTAGAYITIAAYPGETVTIQPSVEGHMVTQNAGVGYFVIDGFVFDGSLLPVPTTGNGTSGVGFFNQSPSGPNANHHFTFRNNEMKHIPRHVILWNGPGLRLQNNKIHDNRTDCTPGRRFYGLYIHAGDDILIENNEIYNTGGGYMQVYEGPLTDVVIRKNYFHDNTYCSSADFGGTIAGNNQGTQYYNNISVRNGSHPTSADGSGLHVTGVTGTPQDVLVLNNTFSLNQAQGVAVTNTSSAPLRTILQNLLSVSNGLTNISNTASATTTVQTTNKNTGTVTDYMVSTSDYTLKTGSPCIDFGTPRSGFAYNGSAPDCGAFESIPNPAASITTNKITLIFPMNLNVPIQNLSTAGVTVGCTGSACPGSPTVSAVSRVVGTDTHVEITVAGIAGNACVSANQNWTVTYNSATGTWTDNANIGYTPGIHQKIFSFTSLPVTNQCTGAPASGYPAGYHLFSRFNEATGTNANDESANNLDLTLTNSPTWGSGKTGAAVVMTAGTDTHVAVPYGNAVNPSTQSMTIAFGVNVPAGLESSTLGVFGASVGTNQRGAIEGKSGTWRLSIYNSNSNSGASSLAVTSGWNHLCLVFDSGTDTATLYLNGVAGTGSASKAYASYALASNFKLGLYDINTSPGGTYDDFVIYNSVQSCSDIYTAFQAVATPGVGTLTQSAVQGQGVYMYNGAPWNFGSLVPTIETVANGALAIVFQVTCENITDCDPTAFKLVYSKNETASVAASFGRLQQVPNVETSEGIRMWGATFQNGLNTGATSTRLVGSCAVTTGSTQVTADQIPNVDLPQDGCVMLRYLVSVGDVAGSYFELRLLTESGLPLDGGYADARINVVNHRGSAF